MLVTYILAALLGWAYIELAWWWWRTKFRMRAVSPFDVRWFRLLPPAPSRPRKRRLSRR